MLSWLAVAPAAAPLLTVAFATPPIVPVKLPLTVPVCVAAKTVASLVLSTLPRPTFALVVPALIVLVLSWLAVAPAAAPLLTVAFATPPIVPVKLPAKVVASLVLSTLPKPILALEVPAPITSHSSEVMASAPAISAL